MTDQDIALMLVDENRFLEFLSDADTTDRLALRMLAMKQFENSRTLADIKKFQETQNHNSTKLANRQIAMLILYGVLAVAFLAHLGGTAVPGVITLIEKLFTLLVGML